MPGQSQYVYLLSTQNEHDFYPETRNQSPENL